MGNIPIQYQSLPGYGTVYAESELRQAIAFAEVNGIAVNPDGTFVNTSVSGSTATVTGLISTSTSGSVAAGKLSVTVANIGTNTGIVKGVPFPAGTSLTWEAPPRRILDSISYDATGTTLLIATLS